MKSWNKFKQNWQLILIIHYVIHQEWTHKYQNINTFQVSAFDFETFIFAYKNWWFSQQKKISDQIFSLDELKNSFKHMNASSYKNRDNLWSSRDTGYTFVILPLVPDRLYIERGRGDWAGTGRFRHWNEKVKVKWHQTGSRLNDF